MDNQYLIDTNIIIYYLDNQIPQNHIASIVLIDAIFYAFKNFFQKSG